MNAKLMSTRARAQLWKLQNAVREASGERNEVLRVLLNARGALAPEAQRELWMEFSCADQEYRHSVAVLGEFVRRHDASCDFSEPLPDRGAPEGAPG